MGETGPIRGTLHPWRLLHPGSLALAVAAVASLSVGGAVPDSDEGWVVLAAGVVLFGGNAVLAYRRPAQRVANVLLTTVPALVAMLVGVGLGYGRDGTSQWGIGFVLLAGGLGGGSVVVNLIASAASDGVVPRTVPSWRPLDASVGVMAGSRTRLVARLLDVVLLAAVAGGTVALNEVAGQDGAVPSIVVFFLLLLLPAIYFLVATATTGRTIGKALLGVRVVSVDGDVLTVEHVLRREWWWLLVVIPLLGWVTLFVILVIGAGTLVSTSSGPPLHDAHAGTTVVETR